MFVYLFTYDFSRNIKYTKGVELVHMVLRLGSCLITIKVKWRRRKTMASVFDVAKYILHEIGTVTTWKLQKLVYYCQAWSLVWDDEPLFEEDFQAWANGPVCPELFRKHSGMYRVREEDIEGDIDGFTQSQRETMDAVLEHYGDKEPYWLRELTHEEDPWKEARGNCGPGEKCTNTISKSSMQMYYASL